MNAARKVDAILNVWFDYIALEDYSNAKIENPAALIPSAASRFAVLDIAHFLSTQTETRFRTYLPGFSVRELPYREPY